MTRTLRVDTPHGKVTAKLVIPPSPRTTAVLLAHGAGAGQAHPWMVEMRRQLAARNLTVMTFNYAYTEQGRKAPDRLPKLVEVHQAVAQRLSAYNSSIVLAGKSMGGRVGGHLVADNAFQAVGLVYLGYPLVALGKTEPRSTEHIESLSTPQLFISGDRDRLGPVDLIRALGAKVPNGEVVEIPAGDHSLVPLKSSGSTLDDSLQTAAESINNWIGTV